MSTDPQVKTIEKIIANEEKQDEKSLKHAIKDLKAGEKAESKAHKMADKAQHALDKVTRKEHDSAKAINKAKANHEKALTDVQQTQKTIDIKHQREAKLEEDVRRQQTLVNELQQKKDQNDQAREARIAQLHTHGAAGAGAGSMTTSPASMTGPSAAEGGPTAAATQSGPTAPVETA
ncbi:hypothetical protein OE88DRAFT_693569 [Heliocybe sulcata]|uniref:Uncharacterized protein n=1 Tax=Heliocybe sulcata TaxID=5364 RepID=A0A5C3NGK6_9AGAM|nr:hypothetical protein OE88DRAFT_693569 [Heliocybe sulcata]